MNRFVPTHGKFWAVVLATGLGATAALGQDNKPAETLTPIAISEMNRTEPVDFQREILPILKQNCLACHSSAATESELVLETPADILRGGSQGPSAAPGKGAESLLLKIASHQLAPRMPPVDNKVGAVDLTPEQLGLIKLWIDQGAQGQVVRETNAARWRPLPPGVNPIYAVVVSSDGQLAACSRANQIFVYHVPSGQFLTRLADPALARQGEALDAGVADLDGVRALAISPDGDRIASGGYRVIRLWRRPRNVQSLRIAADPAAVRAVAVSPDGQLLATGTDEHHVQLWSRKTGEKLADFPGHAGPITSLAFSPDGGKLISGSIDQSVRLWDVAARKAAGRLDTPASVSAMAIVNGGAQLATGGPDKILRLWQLPTATPRPLARFPVTAMAIRPDRKQLAAAGEDGRIHLLNLPSGAVAHTLTGHVGPVTNLSFQPDGSRLASAGEDGLLCVWDLAQATLLAQIETGTVPRHVAMHPAGGQLISGDDQGAATLWNLNAPPPMQLEGGSETLPAVAATSADGKWLATAEQVDGRPAVVLRDVASGKLIKLLLAHTDAIQALAFNARR